jgi:hypothetical protein
MKFINKLNLFKFFFHSDLQTIFHNKSESAKAHQVRCSHLYFNVHFTN